MKLINITIRKFPADLYKKLKGYAGEHGLTLAKALEQLLTKEMDK